MTQDVEKRIKRSGVNMKEMASGAHYWNGEEIDVIRRRGNKGKKVQVRVATHLSHSTHEGCGL